MTWCVLPVATATACIVQVAKSVRIAVFISLQFHIHPIDDDDDDVIAVFIAFPNWFWLPIQMDYYGNCTL